MADLNQEQRANLEKLASYLEGLPEDYAHFDMGLYVDDNGDDDAVAHYARHNGGVASCGTTACAVGHGPAAGVLVDEIFITRWSISWGQYARMAFGCGPGSQFFEWLFSEDWSDVDNTHHGAAARIRAFLDKGIPQGWNRYNERTLEDVALYAPYRLNARPQTTEASNG